MSQDQPGTGAVRYGADLALALRIADAADAITMDRFLAVDLQVEDKPDATPVSDADRGVERAVREILGQQRGSDAVLGEEYGLSGPGSGADPASSSHSGPGSGPDWGPGSGWGSVPRRWVVDPVDGTKNFVRGVPVWATLIALMDGAGEPSEADPLGNGTPVVGVVSAPALARRWWAVRDGGAWVSAPGSRVRRLAVSQIGTLSDAFLAYSGAGSWHQAGRGEAFDTLSRSVWRTRGFGDFWSHMLVAEGAVDVSAEPVVNLWDLAALQVVVEEAGGRLTDHQGQARPDGGTVLCTNGRLHAAALEILRQGSPA